MKSQDIVLTSIQVWKNTVEFFSFMGRVNRVILAPESMSVADPLTPESMKIPEVAKTQEDLKAEKVKKEYAFFSHSRKRLEERYGMSLTQDIWSGWNNLIRRKDPNALFLYKTDTGGDIWRVWFAAKIVFVVFKEDKVVTVLPHDPKFEPAIKRALALRQKEISQRLKVEEEVAKSQPPVTAPSPIPVLAPVVASPKPKQVDKRTMDDFMKDGIQKTVKLQKMKNKYVTPHSGM